MSKLIFTKVEFSDKIKMGLEIQKRVCRQILKTKKGKRGILK